MRDSVTEHILTEEEGVEWEYHEAIPLTDIDMGASHLNQSRLDGRVDRESVESIALALKDGRPMPASVVYRHPKLRKYILIDGVHRETAKRQVANGDKNAVTDVYEIKNATASHIDHMTRSFNARREGRRPGREDRIEQALQLMSGGAMTATQAAARQNVPASAVQSAMRQKVVIRALTQVGKEELLASLKGPVLLHLHKLSLIPVLIKAAETTVEYALTADQAKELVAQVAARGTEAEQLIAIDHFRTRADMVERRANTRHGKLHAPRSPQSMLLLALRAVVSATDKNQGVACRDDLREQLEALWLRAQAAMGVLLPRQSAARQPNGSAHEARA